MTWTDIVATVWRELVELLDGNFMIAVLGLIALQVESRIRTARQSKKLDKIDEQVSNDHSDKPGVTANLREDLDEKHGELVGVVRTLTVEVDSLTDMAKRTARDVGGMKSEIRDIRRRDDDAVKEHNSLWQAIRELISQKKD